MGANGYEQHQQPKGVQPMQIDVANQPVDSKSCEASEVTPSIARLSLLTFAVFRLLPCGATTTSSQPTAQKPIRISVIASWPFIHGGYEDCASTYVCDLPRGIFGLKLDEKNRKSVRPPPHASRPRRVTDDEQAAMAHFASQESFRRVATVRQSIYEASTLNEAARSALRTNAVVHSL
jgi:hypothetical protein